MESEQQRTDRDAAVRAVLVARATRSVGASAMRFAPERLRGGLVTVVVLLVVVVLSVLAVRFGTDRSAPAHGGVPVSSAPALPPGPTMPAGEVLGRWTSADGPVQTHTIRPHGLALAEVFDCSGPGRYTVSISHDSEQGGDGGCGREGGSGNKGHQGTLTVKITTAKAMRWTLTIVGIPETYVTPRPIATPTDSTGTAVRYCTADDLRARFTAGTMPKGVTEVSGGELAFTNRSGSACALAGYPEVRFLEGEEPLGHNTMNHTDQRSTIQQGLRAVIIAPNHSAYSQIDWYLADYYPENEEGACDALAVSQVQVDLAYDLSSAGQTGTLDVPIGRATACLNGAHGALGKYGQLSSTVFVDYTTGGKG